METKAEDPIHKLRLKISETMLDKQASDLKHHANNQPNPNATFRVINNTNNITNNNTTTNYNSNSDDFLLNGIVGSGDDFENLTINTPRTDVNNDEDDEDEQRLDDGEGEGEYGGGGYGDTEDSNRSPQHLTDRDRHYPYTSDTHLNKLKNVNSNNSLNNHSSNNSRSNNYNHNRNQGPSKQSVVHHNKSSSLGRGSETSNKSPTNTTTNTDSSKSPTTHTNTETPTGHHQQQQQQQHQPQQQQPTKYKNNILNYYFNDKSVNHNELSPRYPQEAQSTYRVPIHNTTNNNHPYNATTTTNHSNPVASQPPRQIAAPVAAPNNNPNPRHQIMSDINNHHQQQQQPQQHHSTTNNHQQHYSEPSYNSTNQYKHLDPTNPDNNHISSLLASGDLELDEPQPDFYLGEPESNSNAQRQRSRFNMMQSPTAANYMNRKPPNNLPPLSNIGLVDLATNQFSSASLLSSQQQQQPQLLQAQRSNPSLMTNPNIMTTNPASFSAHPSFNNSTNPMMMMNPASNSLPLGYRSSQMPINLPLGTTTTSTAVPNDLDFNNFPGVGVGDFLGRSEPFDALQTRRRLLNEMSQTNLRMPSSNNGVNAIRPSAQYPLNSVIETRMAPLGSNNLVGAALNETLVSNDVDDLIDVMAKRRIAIKKLEHLSAKSHFASKANKTRNQKKNEMYRQHSRASSMIRPSYDDQLMKTASQMNLRYVDPYSINDRSSRAGQMMMQQGPPPPPGLLSYENPLVAGRTPSMINSMGDLTSRPNALNLISNLDYPSESNREIYSTYLVDSIRPHYSAKRLLNGIRPGPPGSSVPRPQHTSSLYNNQQPVNSYGGGGLGDDLGSPSRQYRAQPFNDYNNNSLYTNSSSSMMMRNNNNNNNNNNYANQNSVENDQFADDYLYD